MRFNKFVVIGTGLAGCTVARLLAEKGYEVTLIGDHLGGACEDAIASNRIRYDKHGPHIFHTSNGEVLNFIKRFGEWRPYIHYVKTVSASGELRDVPVTIKGSSVEKTWTLESIKKSSPCFFGRLYTEIFEGYTRKQWGFSESIPEDFQPINRIKIFETKSNEQKDYFPGQTTLLPITSYNDFFVNLVSHSNINLVCQYVKPEGIMKWCKEEPETIFFSSESIDKLFPSAHLPSLKYRSLRFVTDEVKKSEYHNPTPTLNYASKLIPFTRQTCYRQYMSNPDSFRDDVIQFEFPSHTGYPYYPLDWNDKQKKLYEEYKKLLPQNYIPIGRVGLYKYMNMDTTIETSFKIVKEFLENNNG